MLQYIFIYYVAIKFVNVIAIHFTTIKLDEPINHKKHFRIQQIPKKNKQTHFVRDSNSDFTIFFKCKLQTVD